jgi:hypothetical protein
VRPEALIVFPIAPDFRESLMAVRARAGQAFRLEGNGFYRLGHCSSYRIIRISEVFMQPFAFLITLRRTRFEILSVLSKVCAPRHGYPSSATAWLVFLVEPDRL